MFHSSDMVGGNLGTWLAPSASSQASPFYSWLVSAVLRVRHKHWSQHCQFSPQRWRMGSANLLFCLCCCLPIWWAAQCVIKCEIPWPLTRLGICADLPPGAYPLLNSLPEWKNWTDCHQVTFSIERKGPSEVVTLFVNFTATGMGWQWWATSLFTA